MLRYLAAAVTAAGVLMAGGAAVAQPVTYYVYSTPYTTASSATACPVGSCAANYTTSQKLTGQFTLAGAPPPGENGYDVNMGIAAFSLSDGQNTYTDADLYVRTFINTAKVNTNASGQITGFEFKFDRVNTAGSYPINDPNNPAARVSSIWFSSAGALRVLIDNNAICTLRGDNAELSPGVAGATLGAGCRTSGGTNAQGVSSASATNVTVSLTPPPPAPVPTLSEWAMILLGVLLAGGAALSLHRRRQTA